MATSAFMRTQLISCRLPKPTALYCDHRSFTTCAVSPLSRQLISVGGGLFPRPRIQVVHGTVPQQCAGNKRPARSEILCRPALGELRCRPLPTSSALAPEVTPN